MSRRRRSDGKAAAQWHLPRALERDVEPVPISVTLCDFIFTETGSMLKPPKKSKYPCQARKQTHAGARNGSLLHSLTSVFANRNIPRSSP